jgi:hypothetical protein
MDGTEYTVKVNQSTHVSYKGYKQRNGGGSMAHFSEIDPKVSYGDQTSAPFQRGITTFVAGPSVPNTDPNHTPLRPSIFDTSSVNTAVPNSKVPDSKVPDSEVPDNEVPK